MGLSGINISDLPRHQYNPHQNRYPPRLAGADNLLCPSCALAINNYHCVMMRGLQVQLQEALQQGSPQLQGLQERVLSS